MGVIHFPIGALRFTHPQQRLVATVGIGRAAQQLAPADAFGAGNALTAGITDHHGAFEAGAAIGGVAKLGEQTFDLGSITVRKTC